jgi:putative peptidoglycan lipid II flippase
VPATVGIVLLAEPLVYLFFERGAFDSIATYMTSRALIFYSLGLVGSSLRLMLNKVYYSFQDTLTPMINGAIAVVLNLILNLILVQYMAHSGLALATSISATVTTIMLFLSLRKKVGAIGLTKYLICFIKTLAAALIMGIIVFLIYFKLGPLLPATKIVQVITLFISVAVGAVAYFGLCILFKVRELTIIFRR